MTRAERARFLHGIYVIVNEGPRTLDVARAALDGGVRLLQYRAKRGIDEERIRALVALAHERGALVLLNDDWRAAAAFGCDGAHLGADDDGFGDLRDVRAALGDGLVGLSCANEQEMRAAHALGADYAGVGPVYATSSKDDAGAAIGTGGLRRIAAAAPLPVAAIGGITPERIADVRAAGAAMAAAIAAVERATNPTGAARALVAAWNA